MDRLNRLNKITEDIVNIKNDVKNVNDKIEEYKKEVNAQFVCTHGNTGLTFTASGTIKNRHTNNIIITLKNSNIEIDEETEIYGLEMAYNTTTSNELYYTLIPEYITYSTSDETEIKINIKNENKELYCIKAECDEQGYPITVENWYTYITNHNRYIAQKVDDMYISQVKQATRDSVITLYCRK